MNELPQSVGQIKLLYTYKGGPHHYGPRADQKHRIRLCPDGNPQVHILKSQPWILYSYIRQHLPGHSRAYFCLGEDEKGHAFVARISLDLWRIYTLYGEKAFLSTLKPIPIMQLEYQLRRHATRIGNLWTLPLPTNWARLREWALKKLNWDLVPRTYNKRFRLLGNSGWFIELGGYTRPWHRGGNRIAVAGGRIFAPELHQRLHLRGPHLIGITHGWEYR